MLLAWSFNALMQFGVWPAVFKLVSTMPCESMKNGTLFVATLASPVSVVAGFAVAAIVGDHWQLNFLISGVGLVIFALLWEIISRSLSSRAIVTELVAPDKAKVESSESFWRLMVRSGLLILLAVSMFKSLFDNAIKAFSPSIISNIYDNVTPKLATVMNIAILIVGVMGTVSAYVISRHFKNESVVIAICFCIAIPFFAFSLLAGKVNYWLIVISLAFSAMLMGACTLYTTSFIASRFNTIGRGATVAGIINCVACLGIVVANIVFPAIADAFGWNSVLITWIVLIVLAAALALTFIPKWTKFLKSR